MKYLFLLLLSLSVGSCGKKATVHIRAINAVTGEPYAGLTYGITGTSSGYSGEKKVFEETGVLDANGEAYVSIRVRTGRTYNVGTSKPENMCYTKFIQSTFGKEDLPNLDFQFEYAECSNFNLEIHNVNCQGPSDSFTYKRTWLNGDDQGIFQTQTGCYNFVSNSIKLPMGNYKYEWQVTRNGITTYHDTLFSLVENQTYTFVLNY